MSLLKIVPSPTKMSKGREINTFDMNLKDDDIKEFKEIWQEEFGEDLSDADARIAAMLLLKLFSLED